MIDDSDDEEEASGPRRRGRSASGSASLSGSEEEGSEGEENGLASDLSGDDSHDMEGGFAAAILRAGSGLSAVGRLCLRLCSLEIHSSCCEPLQGVTPARRTWSTSCGLGTHHAPLTNC